MNTRHQWSMAYRNARAWNWGTLWMEAPSMAERAIGARDHTRKAPMLTARRFKLLGYYEKRKRS